MMFNVVIGPLVMQQPIDPYNDFHTSANCALDTSFSSLPVAPSMSPGPPLAGPPASCRWVINPRPSEKQGGRSITQRLQ